MHFSGLGIFEDELEVPIDLRPPFVKPAGRLRR
jgi:hypothetical protein